MNRPWLSLIGIGEDGRAGLAPPALAALDAAHVVVGGKRHLALVAPRQTRTMSWPSPIEAILPELVAMRGTPVAVLATGDPFHYGVGTMLSHHVAPTEMKSFPQPSAFSLAASRLCWALQTCALVSLHGRDERALHPHLMPGARVLILSWDATTPARVASFCLARGLGASRIVVLEAMGGPRERVRETKAEAFDLTDIDPLNTIAVECFGADGAQRFSRGALPDDSFSHDGQITKQSIRALVLAALAPRDGDLLWDIGAGSGSVAIEWLRLAPGADAVAIEARQDRADRIAQNAARHGVAPKIVVGEAPRVLVGLHAPDAVFVGGGTSDPAVIDAAVETLKPAGRLVANAVTIEAQSELSRRHQALGGELHWLQHAQATPVGRFSGWRPAMPIVQWRWTKPA